MPSVEFCFSLSAIFFELRYQQLTQVLYGTYKYVCECVRGCMWRNCCQVVAHVFNAGMCLPATPFYLLNNCLAMLKGNVFILWINLPPHPLPGPFPLPTSPIIFNPFVCLVYIWEIDFGVLFAIRFQLAFCSVTFVVRFLQFHCYLPYLLFVVYAATHCLFGRVHTRPSQTTPGHCGQHSYELFFIS